MVYNPNGGYWATERYLIGFSLDDSYSSRDTVSTDFYIVQLVAGVCTKRWSFW